MDSAGWAEVSEVLDALSVSREELDRAVERNDKARLEIVGARIRACQGHSLDGMSVTMAGLESSWEIVIPTASLWHATVVESIGGIAESGVSAVRRTHVHMAINQDSNLGKRSNVDLLIEVDPMVLGSLGISVFRAPNGVLLVRSVPRRAIVGVYPTSPAGEQNLSEARAILELP